MKVDQQERVMTILEHNDEVWISIYDPNSHEESVVAVDGRDWVNFKIQLGPCYSMMLLFKQAAKRLLFM